MTPPRHPRTATLARMWRRRFFRAMRTFCALALAPALSLGCISSGERARLIQENEGLRRDTERLNRLVADRDADIANLSKQVENLKTFERDRPADLFSPTKLEIVRRSGGADYDAKSGDDGVTVYLRLLDPDGDVVKVGGRIRIELQDNTTPGAPRVVGLYVFDKPAELRKLWYGRFGTQHFTLKCPFPAGFTPPASGKLTVRAEFDDYLTGRTLSALEEVSVAKPVK